MSNEINNKVEMDPLAVGLTRSPVFMGVNLRLFFGNLIACTLISINLQTCLGIPLFLGIHLFMAIQSIKEPNFLWLWFKALTKTPPMLNSSFWGGVNSYETW